MFLITFNLTRQRGVVSEFTLHVRDDTLLSEEL